MNVPKLISQVEKYPELYDTRHSEYYNNLRREEIWEEIGMVMKQPGAECKDRWAKVRDNHRKALQRRKTKSGLGAKSNKPPKFCRELSFLVPHIINEENRTYNSSQSWCSTNQNEEENILEDVEDGEQNYYDGDEDDIEMPDSPIVSLTSAPVGGSRPPSATSSRSSSGKTHTRLLRKRVKLEYPKENCATSVLNQYWSLNEQTKAHTLSAEAQEDSLASFFTSMTKTVREFPLLDQIEIKKQIFKIVSDKEMEIALRVYEQPSRNIVDSVHSGTGNQ